MISSLTMFILVTLTLSSILSGYYWQDRITAQYYNSMIQFLFGGKFRSVLTSNVILSGGIVIVGILDRSVSMFEIVLLLLGSEIFFIGLAFGFFLNFKIGSRSYAPCHRYLVYETTKKTIQVN